MWQVVDTRLSINEHIQYCYHLALPRNTAVSLLCSFPKLQGVLWMSVVTDTDFTGQRRWLLWLFPSGGQPEVKRGSMSCLPKEDLLFCPLAWSLSWLPTWKALCPTGKEYAGQFHCLLICSALGTSVKTCFSATFGGIKSAKGERRAS